MTAVEIVEKYIEEQMALGDPGTPGKLQDMEDNGERWERVDAAKELLRRIREAGLA